jgi:hypothetical protein
LIGLVACISAFRLVQEQMAQYDRVQGAIQSGRIVVQNNGTLWWKDRAGVEHPYVEAVPEKRPRESDVWWTVLLPFGGFLVPWGSVMVLAWIAGGFMRQDG